MPSGTRSCKTWKAQIIVSYLLKTLYVPGTILNSGDISVNKNGKFPDLEELTFYLLETDNAQLLKLQMLWGKK